MQASTRRPKVVPGLVLTIVTITISVLAALLVTAAVSHAVLAQPERDGEEDADIASVAFAEVIGDQDVVGLLEDYDLQVAAVHMWTSGLTGVRKAYNEGLEQWTPEEVIGDARASSIKHFEDALAANAVRLEALLEQGKTELVSDAESVLLMRSLLSTQEQLTMALEHMRRGGAIIYGIEIKGNEESLGQLSRDDRVAEYRLAGTRDNATEHPRPTKPSQYNEQEHSSYADDLDINGLYEAAALVTREGL